MVIIGNTYTDYFTTLRKLQEKLYICCMESFSTHRWDFQKQQHLEVEVVLKEDYDLSTELAYDRARAWIHNAVDHVMEFDNESDRSDFVLDIMREFDKNRDETEQGVTK